MGMVDMLMNLASSKAKSIAKVTGKSPEQVMGALNQAKKMIPDIIKNVNSPQAGAQILQNMGINKSFINDTFNKYSKFASMIPGLNESGAKSMLGELTGAMRGNENAPNAEVKKQMFERSKYPKV